MSFTQRWQLRVSQWLQLLASFPWRSTAQVLAERFREDRLGLTASSLTFTTTIALVPLLTVALAVFTAFPMFSKLQAVLQQWLVDSLIPDNIARQVIGYLTQFASKASKLGVAGAVVVMVTALALVFTIDRTLNAIWRVRVVRPFGQRLLVYWAAITLGPLLLGASLTITSFLLPGSRELLGTMAGSMNVVLDLLGFLLLAAGMAAMYHFVPNTQVKWAHAWAGGVFVSAGIEVAKRLLSAYLASVPTYTVVYGAFATVPILLIWIYTAWVIILLGAVIAAYLPSLLAGVTRRATGHGWRFDLALECLQQLNIYRELPHKGLPLMALVERLQVDAVQLEPILEALAQLDWVGKINELDNEAEPRFILLVQPEVTALAPLLNLLLLQASPATYKLHNSDAWRNLRLSEVL